MGRPLPLKEAGNMLLGLLCCGFKDSSEEENGRKKPDALEADLTEADASSKRLYQPRRS